MALADFTAVLPAEAFTEARLPAVPRALATVSAKDGIEYDFYGFAIVNALVLGKVILIAEDFRFAEWFRDQRPIYAILAKSVAFAILLLIFDIIEEEVVGKFKGKTIGESFRISEMGARKRSSSSLLSFLSR